MFENLLSSKSKITVFVLTNTCKSTCKTWNLEPMFCWFEFLESEQAKLMSWLAHLLFSDRLYTKCPSRYDADVARPCWTFSTVHTMNDIWVGAENALCSPKSLLHKLITESWYYYLAFLFSDIFHMLVKYNHFFLSQKSQVLKHCVIHAFSKKQNQKNTLFLVSWKKQMKPQ